MLKCRDDVGTWAVHTLVSELRGAVAVVHLGVREPSAPAHEPAFDLGANGVAIHIMLGEDPPEEYANLQEALHFFVDPCNPTRYLTQLSSA
jgi:hypothetical protein